MYWPVLRCHQVSLSPDAAENQANMAIAAAITVQMRSQRGTGVVFGAAGAAVAPRFMGDRCDIGTFDSTIGTACDAPPRWVQALFEHS